MRPALAASALALAAGCSSSSPSFFPSSMLASDHRLSSAAPTGPRTLKAFPFDYSSLPALESVPLTADLGSTSLSFLPGKGGAELSMTGALVAEIEIGAREVPTSEGDIDLGPGGRKRDAGSRVRHYHVFRQVDETGPMAWSPAAGAMHLCGHAASPGRARWQGYLHGSRTAEGLDFVCYEGPFDPRTCSATAERAWRVKARPLVGGAVFGFRVEDGECSPPTRTHAERLAVVGPRPLWIGSTAPLALHRVEGERSFARIVPVSRAESASALLDVRPEDLRRFRGDPGAVGGPSLLSFSVEVLWPGADQAPSAVGFMSVLSGNTSAMSANELSQIER